MANSRKFVDRTSDNVAEIDKFEKNKFKWEWLEQKDANGTFMSSYMRKTFEPGQSWCVLCRDVIRYASSGKKSFFNHSQTKKHLKNVESAANSQILPAAYRKVTDISRPTSEKNGTTTTIHSLFDKNSKTKSQELPYGAAPNLCGTSAQVIPAAKERPFVSFNDRVSHGESRIMSFIAEHSLPLSITGELIKLGQELATDTKVLQSLQMERASATYKLKYGLAHTIHKRLVEDMKTCPFSLNIDECTANNNQKVMTILAIYYSPAEEKTVVHHYASLKLTVTKAYVLRDTICAKLDEDNIPLVNMISLLTDSASTMRGKLGGLQVLLKAKASHLIDIDGDNCHHVHNIVKNFCSCYERIVEGLVDDLHTEYKYCKDLLGYLRIVCQILNIRCHTPPERVAHRWLSVYDVLVTDHEMLKAFEVMYYPCIPDKLKYAYKEIVDKSLRGISKVAKGEILELQQKSRGKYKASTVKGKARKDRIVEKLFFLRDQTNLHINLYLSVLPTFKSFVLIFEQKTPLPHRLHDEIYELVKHFLGCFIRPEKIRDLGPKELMELKLDDNSLFLDNSTIFVGEKCEVQLLEMKKRKQLLKEKSSPADDFFDNLRSSYIKTAKYVLKKLPLNNHFLIRLSAVDPRAIGYGLTNKSLKGLAKYFPTVISTNEIDAYKKQVIDLQLAKDLPTIEKEDGSEKALDEWWTEVFRQKDFPQIQKVMLAVLSICVSPHVEQSFSVMNTLISKKTNRLDITTYAAYQDVKYDLSMRQTNTLSEYRRDDPLRTPVDRHLCYNMQTSHARFKEKSVAEREAEDSRKRKLDISQTSPHKRPNVHTVAMEIKQCVLKGRVLPGGK